MKKVVISLIFIFVVGFVHCSHVEEGAVFQGILYTGCILFAIAFLLVNFIMCCPCRCIFLEPCLQSVCCVCLPKVVRRKLSKLESINQEFCWLFGFCCEEFEEEEEEEKKRKKKEGKENDSKNKQSTEEEEKPILSEKEDYDSLLDEEKVEEEQEQETKSLSINNENENDDDETSKQLENSHPKKDPKEERILKKEEKEKKKKKELQYCRTYINWVLISFLFLVIPYETILVWNEFNQLDRPFTCPPTNLETDYYIRYQPSPVGETWNYMLDLISQGDKTLEKDLPVVYGILNLLQKFQPKGKKKLEKKDLPEKYICDLTEEEMKTENKNIVSFVKIQSFSLLMFIIRSVIELFVVIGAVLAFRKPLMKILSVFSKIGCTLYILQWVAELLIILVFSVLGFSLFVIQIIEFFSDGKAILPNFIFTVWILCLEIIVVWRTGLCYSFTNISCTLKWWKFMFLEPYLKLSHILCKRTRGCVRIFFCGFSLCCLSWLLFILLQVYVLPRLILWGIPPYVVPNFIAVPLLNQLISIIDVVAIIGLYISCGCGICLRQAWKEKEFKYRDRYGMANFTSSFRSMEQKNRKSKEELEEKNDLDVEESEGIVSIDGMSNFQVIEEELDDDDDEGEIQTSVVGEDDMDD